jgi:hypothetical protein
VRSSVEFARAEGRIVSKRQLVEWVTRVLIGSLISAASIHATAASACIKAFSGPGT